MFATAACRAPGPAGAAAQESRMHLKDKVVAVTGGGRGIGKAIATAFAVRGAHVGLIDLNTSDLESASAELTARGARVRTELANVTKEDEVARALDAVIGEFGRLDVMINNAGITKDALLIKAKDRVVTGKMSLDQWRAVIDVDLTGVFLCAREAAERMVRLGNGGVVISVSSISRAGNHGQTNYSAAKAGVVAMSVVWAKELARYGIRTGTIAPGFTRTDILASMTPETLERVTAPVPLKRLGLPEEIAHAAVFIAENDFFSGRCIDVDGGLRL
jgi:3-oxoacyl-[acyl-carrier protein] reductase